MYLNWETLLVSTMGGIVSALITQLVPFIRDGWKSKKDKTYSALRVAIILERYAFACHAHIMFVEGDIEAGRRKSDYVIPNIDKYPDDIDWKLIDVEIANDALSMPHKIEDIKSKIMFGSLYEGNDYLSLTEASLMGMNAYSIAVRLREKYRLPKLDEEEKHIEDLRNRNEYILKRRHNIEAASRV